MEDLPESEARSLKFLRTLVTVLTTVMIIGFIVLIGFLVTRFPGMGGVEVPGEIALPEGRKALAFTRGPDWFAVVTDADEILIYGADGTLRQTVKVDGGD